MGNWHCVPSSCAEVVYQEYSGSVVRWRYPGEAWQEINGDDYSVDRLYKHDTVDKFKYKFTAKAICSTSSPPPGVDPDYPRNYVAGQIIDVYLSIELSGPIFKVEKVNTGNNANLKATHTTSNCSITTQEFTLNTQSPAIGNTRVRCTPGSYTAPCVTADLFDIQLTPTVAISRTCNAQPDKCTFTIFRQGQTIHTETRAVCPEVEKIPCKLSDVRHSIKIKKFPYLERVEVVDYAYQVYLGLLTPNEYGLILQKVPIPNECLNIYHNDITATIPFDNFPNFANAPTSAYKLVAQICSAPGCPPPEYTVICDCNNCQSCPGDTCPVECGDHVCCYNVGGISVAQIPKSDYCGGNL